MSSGIKLRALIGPNRWAPGTVLEVRSVGSAGGIKGLLPPPILAAIETWLRRRDLLAPGSRPLAAQSWAAQLSVLIASICRSAHMPAPDFIAADDPRTLRFAIHDPSFGRLCVDAAFALCQYAEASGGRNEAALDGVLETFHGHAVGLGLDLPIRMVATAATRLGVSHRRHSLLANHYLLGEGRHQVVLDATDTNSTAAMAKDIAGNKDMAATLLAAYGLPVARQQVITQSKEAWPAARAVGLPAVIKPRIGNQGNGVSLNIASEQDAAAAFESAKAIHDDVLVESTLPGDDHRVMVVREGVIALRREPPRVTGDGKLTIAQLIEQENAGRRDIRGALKKIEPNPETDRLLAAQSRTLDTVLAAGEMQQILMIPDSSWRRTDVSQAIHPETRRMLLDAARLIGLDVASIDFRTPDITKSWKEVGGGICEVESRSGLWALVRADAAVVEAFVGHLLTDRPLHVPQIVVAGRGDLAPLDEWAGELVQRVEQEHGWRTAVLTSKELAVAGRVLDLKPLTTARACLAAMENPFVELALYVTTIETCLANGVGVDRPDIVIADESADGKALADMARRAGATVLSWRERDKVDELLRSYDSTPLRSIKA